MGKSTAGGILAGLGVSVVDTDDLAREETAPGSVGLAGITAAFGSGVLSADGSLDRGALAGKVFSDPAALRALEAILHPLIFQRWQSRLDQWRRDGCRRAAVVIPLLFEKGYEAQFSAVVTVACGPGSQAARLAARGWSPSDSRSRIKAQLPVDEKMKRAQFVVWTEGSLQSHQLQWERVLAGMDGNS